MRWPSLPVPPLGVLGSTATVTLRRLLALPPTLIALALSVFWLSTEADARGQHSPLPRFFNAQPRDVRDVARALLRRIADDAPDAAPARTELVRIGGAALPHLLPELDALAPAERARVARALSPIALRMKVATAEELGSDDAAVLFWSRFWQDRATDYQPQVVRRAVQRLAERSLALRRDDVTELDTLALPALMEALAAAAASGDVARMRRLATAAAAISGEPWRVPRDASLASALGVAARWRRWWTEHGSEYSTLVGTGRLQAMLTETRFGRWAIEASNERVDSATTGRPVADELRERGPLTAWLIAVGLLGGLLGGALLAVARSALADRTTARPTRAASATLPAIEGLLVCLAALPAVALCVWTAPAGEAPRLIFAASIAIVATLGPSWLTERAALRAALDVDWPRTAAAFGVGAMERALHALRSSAVGIVSLAAVELPTLFGVALIVEHSLELRGVGALTVRAVSLHDTSWLVVLAVLGGAVTALVGVLRDLALAVLDPRFGEALARARRLEA